MAGEIKLNDVSVATEDAGTVTVGNSNVTFDANTVTTNLAFAADHAGIKTALNASGSASVYACRAWVNFNGSGTVSIRASGNVSSITDHGTSQYGVNFTTSMPDANYSAVVTISPTTQALTKGSAIANIYNDTSYTMTTSSFRFSTETRVGGYHGDTITNCVSVFR